MITSGFFNSIDGDRKYNAEQFSSLFTGLITDGVYASVGKKFFVKPGEGLQVIVQSGKAWFDSTWTLNDSDLPLEIPSPAPTLPRYDAVVIDIDKTNSVRNNTIKIVSGSTAGDPEKPVLINTEKHTQHPIAYIKVNPEISSITNENIEIVVGKKECPFVTSIVQSTDIEDLFSKWNDEFYKWFKEVQLALGEDVAGNLLNKIEERLKISDKANEEEAIAGEIDTKYMTPKQTKNVLNKNPNSGKIKYEDDFYSFDVLFDSVLYEKKYDNNGSVAVSDDLNKVVQLIRDSRQDNTLVVYNNFKNGKEYTTTLSKQYNIVVMDSDYLIISKNNYTNNYTVDVYKLEDNGMTKKTSKDFSSTDSVKPSSNLISCYGNNDSLYFVTHTSNYSGEGTLWRYDKQANTINTVYTLNIQDEPEARYIFGCSYIIYNNQCFISYRLSKGNLSPFWYYYRFLRIDSRGSETIIEEHGNEKEYAGVYSITMLNGLLYCLKSEGEKLKYFVTYQNRSYGFVKKISIPSPNTSSECITNINNTVYYTNSNTSYKIKDDNLNYEEKKSIQACTGWKYYTSEIIVSGIVEKVFPVKINKCYIQLPIVYNPIVMYNAKKIKTGGITE